MDSVNLYDSNQIKSNQNRPNRLNQNTRQTSFSHPWRQNKNTRGNLTSRDDRSATGNTSFYLRLLTVFFSVLLIGLTTAAVVEAASVELAWNPVNTPCDGYRLFARTPGESYNYNNPLWTGAGESCELNQLKDDTTYHFVVRAYAGSVESDNSGEITVVTPPAYQPPAAKAGSDQTVDSGTSVTLDGSGSTVSDGHTTTFNWSQIAGPTIQLSNAAAAQPTFIALDVTTDTTLEFKLLVTDDKGATASDQCRVVIQPLPNNGGGDPNQDSDNDGLTDIEEVELYGTDPNKPDTDGDGISDGQEITAGTDPNVADPAPGKVLIWLEAEDGNIDTPMEISSHAAASESGYVWAPFGTGNYHSPSASAGKVQLTFDISAAGNYHIWARTMCNDGASDSFYVAVDGGADMTWHTLCDPKNTWTWDVVSQREALDPKTTDHPMVYALEAGPHTITIKQREDGTKIDRVLVTNDGIYMPDGTGPIPNEAPVAKAGDDQTVDANNVTKLDGSGSSDLEGTIATYQWTQVDGPAVQLSDATSAKPWFTAPAVDVEKTLLFKLVVTDDMGLTGEDTCEIMVLPAPDPNLDSDNDGITDVEEIDVYGTDPHDADSDGDNVSDGQEVKAGSDPLDPTSLPDHTMIWLEAEQAEITAPMQVAQDATASAGGFVWTPSGNGNLYSSTTGAGQAEITFHVPTSGIYTIWARTIGNDGSSDSFYVALDGGPDLAWHTLRGPKDTWTWDVVSERNPRDPRTADHPKVYTLEAGTHTITLKQREDGTKIDKILVTSDSTYIPEGQGDDPATSPDDDQIWLEAEDGDIDAPMEISDDATASAGGYVWTPYGNGNLYSNTAGAGLIRLTFQVQAAGDYTIWARTIGNDGTSDSFYVAMDGGPDLAWHTLRGPKDTWTWDVVSERNLRDPRIADHPKVYTLEAGTHTITFKQREDGTKIDKILVTGDESYMPE